MSNKKRMGSTLATPERGLVYELRVAKPKPPLNYLWIVIDLLENGSIEIKF